MNRKGVFFSLDALFALGVAVVLFTMLFYWSAHLDVGKLRDSELLSYAESVATVMEQQDAFTQSNLSSFLNSSLRNETCFNVTVYSPAMIRQYSAVTEGCLNTSYPLILSRSFVSGNGSLYLAHLEGWYDG